VLIKNIKITYYYRNPKCGFSIQHVFQTLTKEIEKYAEVDGIFMPYFKASLIDIFRNGRFAKKKQSRQALNHITGAEHYLLYFLNAKKTIVTVHDIMYYSFLSGLKRRIWKLLYIDALKKAHKIVFISEFAKKQVIDVIKLQNEKLYVIPCAVSPEYKYCPKQFNKNQPVILHIGTLTRKNLQRTILALTGISCHLRIIGKLNPLYIKLLQENNIEYSNAFNLTDEQIVKEYEQCDIVNFPSTFEGFGMPIIEGQAVGRVVVTSNISPMKDVAGEGAFFVDPFDINSIRDVYLKIIREDSLREQIIEKGRQNVAQYQVENIAQQYMDLYNQIMTE
jgi:glycosyltransferase involved in cell wall biosynthesis